MGFGWDEVDRSKFFQSPHRTRYLKSGFLTNAPPAATPLTRIQYIDRGNVAVNRMSTDSLALFDADSGLYLVPSNALEEMFGGDRTTIKKPLYLWRAAELDKGTEEVRQAKRRKLDELQQYSYASLEAVYDAVIAYHRDSHEKISTDDLRRSVPRPKPDAERPEPVAIALGAGASADPPSRRGETHRRRNTVRATQDGEDGNSSGNGEGDV